NIGLSFLFAKIFARDPYEKNVYRYSTIIPNGNLGFGFAEGVLGTLGVLNFSIYNTPSCIYCYTKGYSLLTKRKMTFKNLLNPTTIALVIGCILGLLPFELPEVLQTLLDKAAACTIPLCMVVIGISISEFKVLQLFKNWRAITFSLIRMVVFPLILRFVLPLFPLEPIVIQMAVLLYALPCGMNSVLFAKMIDEDCRCGAELVLVSNVIAIVSIPLVTMGLF
ncbi:MAG: AEC family transporter, partial [Lachnospiraceae bacterium]|nr:AEC family transporter [Lachnospiraceae bacterium]